MRVWSLGHNSDHRIHYSIASRAVSVCACVCACEHWSILWPFFTNWKGGVEPNGVNSRYQTETPCERMLVSAARMPSGVQLFLHTNVLWRLRKKNEQGWDEEGMWEGVGVIRLIGKIRFVTHSPAVPLAALMASVRTLAPRLSTVDSSDTRKLRRACLRRRVSHAAAVGPEPANYSVPRGIRGDTWDRCGEETGDEGVVEGAGRPQWSDVFIVGRSNKVHFYSAVPPRVMGGQCYKSTVRARLEKSERIMTSRWQNLA